VVVDSFLKLDDLEKKFFVTKNRQKDRNRFGCTLNASVPNDGYRIRHSKIRNLER
jgi:hypothetical protein